jgi:hypothetical protein
MTRPAGAAQKKGRVREERARVRGWVWRHTPEPGQEEPPSDVVLLANIQSLLCEGAAINVSDMRQHAGW